MAQETGLFKKYGVNVVLSKETSWANVRDKLLDGELDCAHCLFSMPLSVYTGIGGTPGKQLKIAMILSDNGQAITLKKELASRAGYGNMAGVKPALDWLRGGKTPTLAMTFPGGTHDIWLRYWLAAGHVDANSVKIVTIPPPQMVANMAVNNVDGYCVGEPWGGVAVKKGVGYTQIATQDIWKNHPEKALVCNAQFAATRRGDLKNVMKAILEVSKWLDYMPNRDVTAKTIGQPGYVNAPADVIDARLHGEYDLGCGLPHKTFSDDYMLFYNNGNVNFPRKSYAIWFLAQYVRFGYLKTPPNYQAIADQLIMTDLYKEVAKEMAVPVPNDDMKPIKLQLDGIVFDPKNPAGSLKKYH